MNTRDLEYLVAVAEELHFGRAAERCNASQPALSGQLQKLEDRLGVRIFERTKRQVRLTAVGQKILAKAREILQGVQDLEALAATDQGPFAGDCVIGMPHTIGPYLTRHLLRATAHYLPELRPVLVEDFTDQLEQRLAAGEMDLVIQATRPARAGLEELVLYEEPFWVALPSNHPLTQLEMVDVNEIDPRELLLLSDGHCLRDQVYEVCGLNRAKRDDGRGPKTQRTSLGTILSLVGAGKGVTLVPATSLSDAWITDAGIAVRREASGKAGRTVRLVYRKGYPRMTLVEKMADIIAGAVPDTVHPVRR